MSESAADFPPPRTWPTILWVIASVVALVVSQVAGVLAFLVWQRSGHPGYPFFAVHGLQQNGAAISIITITSSLVLLIAFLGFTRMRTSAVRLYLGLRLPAVRDFIIAILALSLFLAALGFVNSHLADPRADTFMRSMFVSAQKGHLLWLLLGAVSIAAPIGEEITFRGFLYQTIQLRFGVVAAIIVTALGWAALHIQYGVVSIISIFAIGLFLGWARYYSRSLVLTMILHGLWNGVALIGSAAMFGHS